MIQPAHPPINAIEIPLTAEQLGALRPFADRASLANSDSRKYIIMAQIVLDDPLMFRQSDHPRADEDGDVITQKMAVCFMLESPHAEAVRDIVQDVIFSVKYTLAAK